MPDPIAIDTPQQPSTIAIDNPKAITKNLSPDVAQYRVDNATLGLSYLTGISNDKFKDAITNGAEDVVRGEAANKVDGIRQQFAKQMIDQYGYELPEDMLTKMLSIKQNPNSVIEEHYAKSYMDFLNWPKENNVRDSWAYKNLSNTKTSGDFRGIAPPSLEDMIRPDSTELFDWVKRAGSVSAAKNEYMQTKQDNARGETSVSDTLGTLATDLVTLGFYGESQMRQNAAGTGTFSGGLLLGNNLREQSKNMAYISDFDEWRKEFDSVYENLPPAYREGWVADMIHKNSSSVFMDNTSTLLNGVIAGGIARNAARNVLTPATRAAAFERIAAARQFKVDLINIQSRFENILKATKDMVTPRDPHIPSPVAGPAVAGNIPESAVNTVAIEGINSLMPGANPLSALMDRITGSFDVDGSLAADNPGRLGREAANRLKDMIHSYGPDFVETVFNSLLQRVDTVPTADTVKHLNQIQKGLADMFRGPDNTVVNVSRGIWLPGINRRMFNLAVGSNDAELFSSLSEAMASARRSGWAIKGDYAVGPEERVNILRKENAIKGFRTQAANAATPEGAAKANKLADTIQAELDKIPRHETGVVIRSQHPSSGYTKPIGPLTPYQQRLLAIAATSDESISPALRGIGKGIEKTKNSRTIEQVLLDPDRRLAELEKRTGGTYFKSDIPTIDELENTLGRPATYDEIGQALKEKDLSTLTQGKPPIESFSVRRRGKSYPDIGGDEHLLQYHIRKKMEREYALLQSSDDVDDVITKSKTSSGTSKSKDSYAFPGLISEIKQQGNGYYILHTVFLPETADFVRDGILTSKLGELPKEEFREAAAKHAVSTGIPNDWAGGWVHAITNSIGIAAPSEVMSLAETLNRNIATFGPSVLLGLMKRGLKPFEQMAPKYYDDFNRMLRATQNTWNPITKTPGIWFDDMGQLDDFYQTMFKRQVSEQETRAYFAFKTVMLSDLHFRNLSVYSRKLALGARQHAIEYTDTYGQKVLTPYFEGVRMDKLPENGRVLLTSNINPDNSKVGLIDYILRNNPSVADDIKQGRAQIIQLMDPKTKPLREINSRAVDYVISYKTEEKPLGMNHVNRLGGGHMVPKWPWFVKSADVDVLNHAEGTYSVYNGDKTLLSFQTKAQADEAISILERAREHMARWTDANPNSMLHNIERWENEGGGVGRDWLGEAAQEAANAGIPFRKLLDIWIGPNAPFNVHEPLVAVPKGGKIIDMGTEGAALRARHTHERPDGLTDRLVDGTKGNSLLSQVMPEFTQERDAEGLYTLRRTNTESNPTFAYEHAELLDPITAMERGFSQITKSMYMYDMKQFSMEHWLEQAKEFLEDAHTIRDRPLAHFYNPVYKADIPMQVEMQLESNRKAAIDFIGLPSTFDTAVNRMGQTISDWLFGKGKVVIPKLSDLPMVTKGVDWMKGAVFGLTLASFTSFFTQAATLSYIYMIAGPTNAHSATAAMTMYGLWKKFSGNPEILKYIDRELSMSFEGWKPGRFIEAVKMLEGSGINNVGPEHAFRQGEASLGLQSKISPNGPFDLAVKTTQRFGKPLLNITKLPFELGSASTRVSGFFVAYLEHLAEAPGGILDRQLQASMLRRASQLDINMSKAHNSGLENNKAFSIPMMYWAYDVRMGQMMWGKNLTPDEKKSLFTWSAMLYGMRGGGYALFGFPIANMLTSQAIQNGYVPGQNPVADVMVNGFPSWLFAMYSGFRDPQGRKTWIDFSKWGSPGVKGLEDYFDDKSVAETLGGVGFHAFSTTFRNTWGVRKALGDMLDPHGYSFTMNDALQVLDSFKGFKDLHKGYLAMRTGKWFSENESYITDVSKLEAFFKTFTGLSTIQTSDLFLKEKDLKGIEKDIRFYQNKHAAEIERGLRARDNNDVEGMRTHFTNADVIMKILIPPERWKQTMDASARNAGTDLIKRVDEKYYIKEQNKWSPYLQTQKNEKGNQ